MKTYLKIIICTAVLLTAINSHAFTVRVLNRSNQNIFINSLASPTSSQEIPANKSDQWVSSQGIQKSINFNVRVGSSTGNVTPCDMSVVAVPDGSFIALNKQTAAASAKDCIMSNGKWLADQSISVGKNGELLLIVATAKPS